MFHIDTNPSLISSKYKNIVKGTEFPNNESKWYKRNFIEKGASNATDKKTETFMCQVVVKKPQGEPWVRCSIFIVYHCWVRYCERAFPWLQSITFTCPIVGGSWLRAEKCLIRMSQTCSAWFRSQELAERSMRWISSSASTFLTATIHWGIELSHYETCCEASASLKSRTWHGRYSRH